MREIKFRGLSEYEWVYGFVIFNKDGSCYIKDTDYNVNNGKIDIIPEKVDPQTVGQFTGLHDKNGKEIYEGDVVDGDGLITDVIYSNKWTEFKLRAANSVGWYEHIEVIGNIHEEQFKHLIK